MAEKASPPLDVNPQKFSELTPGEQENLLGIFREMKGNGLSVGPKAEKLLNARAGSSTKRGSSRSEPPA